MSYRTGQAGVAEGLGLVFMITVPRVFLTAMTQVLEQGAQLGWVAVLLGGLYSLAMFYVLLFVMTRADGDLLAMARRLLGRPGSWLVGVFYLVLFWGHAVLLMRQYTENTLITALPHVNFQMVVAMYSAAIGLLLYMGFGAIVRSTYLFLPYLLFGLLMVCLFLIPYYNIYHLTPWRGNGLAAGLKLSVLAAGYNVGVIALIIMAPTFQSLRTIRAAGIYGLGISVAVKVAYMVAYVMVFGVAVGMERTMPFFEMARLVYLSRFLQHIEALLIIIWVVVGMTAVAVYLYIALYILSRLLGLPAIRPLVPLATLFTAVLAMLFESMDIIIVADGMFNYVSNIGLYVVPAALAAAALVKGRKKDAAESG